jgi:hypothetical protein
MVAVVSMQRTVKYPLTNDFWGDLLVTRNSLPSGPLDASITVAAVALVALTGSRWWTSENPYQFRLRSLFILTAVVALVLASGTHTWVAGQLTNRRSAVENDAHKNLVRPAVPCSPYDVQPLPVRILVLFGVGCVIHQGAGALAHLPLVLVRRHTRRLRRPRSPCSSESPDESPAESE